MFKLFTLDLVLQNITTTKKLVSDIWTRDFLGHQSLTMTTRPNSPPRIKCSVFIWNIEQNDIVCIAFDTIPVQSIERFSESTISLDDLHESLELVDGKILQKSWHLENVQDLPRFYKTINFYFTSKILSFQNGNNTTRLVHRHLGILSKDI